MAVSLTRFSWRFWGGKEKEPVVVSNSSPMSPSSEWGFPLKEREAVKFPLVKGAKLAPAQRRIKRKWQNREERRIDRDHDFVLVPSDGGGCLSDSETYDSDWSIGWLEPHGSDFRSDNGDDESDNSFAVLVPCYKNGCKEVESSNNDLFSAINFLPNEFSSAGKNYMEGWLTSLQNFQA